MNDTACEAAAFGGVHSINNNVTVIMIFAESIFNLPTEKCREQAQLTATKLMKLFIG